MQVGFQLSYTAVLGIIILYQNILNWFDPPGWLLRQIWSITAVSLAAQIATFPLGFLYFHQFPVYFLLSNLIVIPISTIIIYGGILLLAIAGWNAAATFVASALTWIVHGMNAIVTWIEHLPFSLMTGISISVIETCLIYVLIGAVIAFFLLADKRYLLVSVAAISLFLASQILDSIFILRQKQLVVYQMKDNSVLNIIDGRRNLIQADEKILADKSKMLFNIYPYWWECGLNEKNCEVIRRSDERRDYFFYRGFLQYGQTRIACLSEMLSGHFSSTAITTDLLILSRNVRVKLSER